MSDQGSRFFQYAADNVRTAAEIEWRNDLFGRVIRVADVGERRNFDYL